MSNCKLIFDDAIFTRLRWLYNNYYYIFFGARGISTNGASSPVFKRIYVLIMSLKKGY